jgi:hypothetical protein
MITIINNNNDNNNNNHHHHYQSSSLSVTCMHPQAHDECERTTETEKIKCKMTSLPTDESGIWQ